MHGRRAASNPRGVDRSDAQLAALRAQVGAAALAPLLERRLAELQAQGASESDADMAETGQLLHRFAWGVPAPGGDGGGGGGSGGATGTWGGIQGVTAAAGADFGSRAMGVLKDLGRRGAGGGGNGSKGGGGRGKG